jgi:antitoxin component of RelBE/YafQ-DinJ toxin-antitoxin module
MSAAKGRVRRADNTATILMQARVPAEVRDEIRAAAEASGVSFALYIETFIMRTAHERGMLPVYTDIARPQWEELPIPAA